MDFPKDLEMQSSIEFFVEEIDFNLKKPDLLTLWIKTLIEKEAKFLNHLNFIFCDDTYLHQINVEYLNHDTLTDIITFPLAELPQIEGDIFISVERVAENAQLLNLEFEEELHRVLIHGVLHLCGYGDKTTEESDLMRQKENEALHLLSDIGKLSKSE